MSAVLDLLSCGSSSERELVQSIMERQEKDRDLDRLTRLMEESGAIERAHERARFHALSAIGELRAFDESPAQLTIRHDRSFSARIRADLASSNG